MNREGLSLDNATRGSRLVEIGQSWNHSIIVAFVGSVTSLIADVSRNSFVYRWLTTEPEPDVIVIDLTETYTVGPLIRVLDRAVEVFEPLWNSSGSKNSLQRIGLLGKALASESVCLNLMARMLRPPSEVDSRDRRD
jgi:hypothetical protein